eukprot:jgi/Picsp_1/4903/NSC_02267-R1_kda basic
MSTYSSFAFEVTGRVQGVFFRAYTREKASSLGLVGFVRNTPQGSVAGFAQGRLEGMEVFKNWLRNEGSPASRIESCVFSEERSDLARLDFKTFEIKR